MLDSFLNNPAAAAAGFIALVCLTICPLFRTRNGILLAQLGAGVAFASHYALLGIVAPSLVNVLGSVQSSAALFSTRSEALNRIGYGLIPLMVGAGIYFWTGPTSALCVAAMGLIALGRMQSNQWTLRLLILAGGGFWTMHDYLVGAWIALTADVLSLTIGLAMLAYMAATEKALRLSLPALRREAWSRASGMPRGVAHSWPYDRRPPRTVAFSAGSRSDRKIRGRLWGRRLLEPALKAPSVRAAQDAAG